MFILATQDNNDESVSKTFLYVFTNTYSDVSSFYTGKSENETHKIDHSLSTLCQTLLR